MNGGHSFPTAQTQKKGGSPSLQRRLTGHLTEEMCWGGREQKVQLALAPFARWWKVFASRRYELGDPAKAFPLLEVAMVAATGDHFGEPLVVTKAQIPTHMHRGLIRFLRGLHLAPLSTALGGKALETWSMRCAKLFAEPLSRAADGLSIDTNSGKSRAPEPGNGAHAGLRITREDRIFLNAVQVMRLYLLAALRNDAFGEQQRQSLAPLVAVQARYPFLGLTSDQRPIFLARDS